MIAALSEGFSRRRPDFGEGVCALLLGVFGTLVFATMPFFLALVKSSNAYSDSQVSLISSAEMLGMLLANVSAAVWISRSNWRRALMGGIILFVVATFCSMQVHSFIPFAITRIVGGFGAGVLMGVGMTAMGERAQSDSWFGWFLGVQAVLSLATSATIPRFIVPYGLSGYLAMLIGSYLLLIPVALNAPKRSVRQRVDAASANLSTGDRKLAILSLFGVFAFAMGMFSVWSHIELIGSDFGFSMNAIGDAMSLSFFLAIPASLIAGYLALYVKRVWLFSGIGLTNICALLLLLGDPSYRDYAIALLLINMLWSFASPLQLGLTASVDPSGRFIVLLIASMKSSYVASGVILAWLLTGNNHTTRILAFSGVCALVSALIYIYVSAKARAVATRSLGDIPLES